MALGATAATATWLHLLGVHFPVERGWGGKEGKEDKKWG